MTNARLEELRTKFQENPRRYFAPFANELRKAGDTAQAISVCRAHLSGQPGHVSGHIVLGQALYEAGEANEARDIFVAALELDPENLIALRTLGEIAQINGEFGPARQWYERLLEADPRNTEVTQLLKDLPTHAASGPAAAIEALEEVPEALPFNATEKHEPPPNFHTSFTGSQKAYEPEPAEPQQEAESDEANEPEPAAAKYEAEPAAEQEGEPFVAQQAESQELLDIDSTTDFELSEPEPTPEPEPVRYSPAAYDEHDETLDMVDLDTFPSSASIEAQAAQLDVPDESTDSVDEESFDAPAASIEAELAAEVPEAQSPEPPRARFAEFGFDGPVDDQIGWMTTPSASLSEPEAAPEDWFDEAESSSEPSVAEAQAEEPAAAEMIASDPSTDSWFDDVEGAAVIEATEVSNEEFWLPPDLTSVASSPSEPEASAPAAEQVEEVEEPVSSFEPSMESDAPPYAAQEQHEEHEEPGHFNVDVAAEAAEDAVVVERPNELETVSSWSTQETPVSQSDADAPAMHENRESSEREEQAEERLEYASAEAADEIPVASIDAEPALPVAEAPAPTPMGLTPGYDVSSPPPPAQPATPFVTETLAELYVKQGFRDEALAIYRQLAERNPGDESLQLRIQSIEQSQEEPVAQSAEPPSENRAASQSVRTFFSRLARRNAATSPTPTEASKPAPDVPFAAAASALANLFAASKPQASDEGAASTLANAFTDPAGRPSRAADRELSLDHLFRDVPPGGQPGGGVSLDEFYATPNAQPGSPTEPGEAGESTESGGTDIRQFTAWLEGLRKK